jgi:4-hydroxy-2-oxoheptanedioate aldolase
MRENRVRQRWQLGETVLNGWLAIPSSFSAETMAHQGWDSLTIDLQHGIVDYLSTVSMLQAISTTDVTPLVRVAWLDPGIIMKVLDAGAYGVICPMINDAGDAEALVAACRYPPQGQRSFGPIRALLYAGADYPSHANEAVVVLAMIETAKALANLDEILAVPHLDGVYVGPADLSNALGYPPSFDTEERPVVEAIDMILAKTKERGLVAGIHNGSTAAALRRAEKGFRFVTVGSDARLMAAGAKEVVNTMRAESATIAASSTY